MDFVGLQNFFKQVQYKNWEFVVKTDSNVDHGLGRPYLQIEFLAPDSIDETGPVGIQRGRKWWLSYHMCENELVRTAYKAVKTAVEHEVDEQFIFAGARIFDPHMDYGKLAELKNEIGINTRATKRSG